MTDLAMQAPRPRPQEIAPGAMSTVADAIKLACALTEDEFLAIGKRLESAVEILSHLTATFKTLLNELESADLLDAERDLGRAAAQVTEIAGARRGLRTGLDRLMGLTAGIAGRMARVGKAITAVDVLAINAKIAAAGAGDRGADFINFATDIRRALKETQSNLRSFDGELEGVGAAIRVANAGELDFEQRHAESVASIPRRLAASASSIAARRKLASTAASTVQDKSRQSAQRVGSVVVALQIGDNIRQRIEHVLAALALLTRSLSAGPDAAAGQPSGWPPAWDALPAAQRQGFAALVCQLQSAQLADAAQHFDGEVRQIVSALRELAVGARDIVRIGKESLGGTGPQGGVFLLELEESVDKAAGLLEDFRAARANADQVVVSVRDGATRLVGHIDTVRSLEADVRIMGLNTTLKCARLGDAGRSLKVIAQELRTCANAAGVEANVVTVDLNSILEVSASFAGGQVGEVTDIAAVAGVMTASVRRMGGAGRTLVDTLAALERDGTRVATLLEETLTRITVHEKIGAVLRQAAADLAALAGTADHDAARHDIDETVRIGEEILTLIGKSYTMARERAIHDQVVRRSDGSHPAEAVVTAPQTEAAALDDILF